MANLYVKVPGRDWNAHSKDVREMLGLKRTDKLPAAGMDPQVIQGVTVWVNPAPAPVMVNKWGKQRPLKRSTHRVMARCPICGEEMSVGRLHQHAKIHRT